MEGAYQRKNEAQKHTQKTGVEARAQKPGGHKTVLGDM